jgi:hypothetical protein
MVEKATSERVSANNIILNGGVSLSKGGGKPPHSRKSTARFRANRVRREM